MKKMMLGMLIIALAFFACDDAIGPDDSGAVTDPGGNPITYTVTQTGGTNGITDSTGIVFTFSASVDSLNLTAADITVGGKAAKGSAALSGTGTSRTLSITVTSAGLATVTIAKTGIETGTKNVTVYKAGEIAPEYWSITWNFNGGTAGTGAQHPTQIEKSTVLAKPSPDPIKAGNDFVGWYANSALTQTYNFASTVTADLNLYAKWEAVISPTHTHNWGAWTATEIAGTQERICGSNAAHIEARLTGTERFYFDVISGAAAYRVRSRTAVVGTVRIPAYYRPSDQLDYQPVTAIGYFSNNTSLSGIDIPASITSISDGAFAGCSILTNITVDVDNPQYASEGGILYNKTKTTLVAYPSASGNVSIPGVTEIGDYAFYNCSNLTGITIPASVTSIGYEAFYGCASLASITLEEGSQLASIGDSAFRYCTRLTSIEIPASVKSIGSYAFAGESSYNYQMALETVTFAAGSQLASIGDRAFYNCSNLTGITIPASVTSIGSYAFAGEYGGGMALETVTFAVGSQLVSIGDCAFRYCRNLTSIEIPASVTSISYYAFEGWTFSQTIYVMGHASQASADAAWGGSNYWRYSCNAVIRYWNGSEWVSGE